MTSNLEQHRGEPSVWDATTQTECDVERWAAALVAGTFIAAGLQRRSTAGLLMVAGGAALAWWAATGIEVRKERRARLLAALPGSPADPVHEASQASFPASDPPSWTPITGNTPDNVPAT